MSLDIVLFDKDYMEDGKIFGFRTDGYKELIAAGLFKLPHKHLMIGRDEDTREAIWDNCIDLSVHRREVLEIVDSLKIGTFHDNDELIHAIKTKRYLIGN